MYSPGHQAKSLLFRFKDLSYTLGGERILDSVSWECRVGERWWIQGRNGSGKSTLMKMVCGHIWPDPPVREQRVYYQDGQLRPSPLTFRNRVSMVSPELQKKYYRVFNRQTVMAVVSSGLFNTDYLYQELSARQKTKVIEFHTLFNLCQLRERRVGTLSNGELRRVLVARALVSDPHVLVLDEICHGLDAEKRHDILDRVKKSMLSETALIYATHRKDDPLPDATDFLVLEAGRVCSITKAQKTSPARISPKPKINSPLSHGSRSDSVEKNLEKPNTIEIHHADVYVGNHQKVVPILHSIDWEIRKGENWLICGPNGSGKTSLIKLIYGDLHPAAGGKITRFGFPQGRSSWKTKELIGYLSVDLQINYHEKVPVPDVLASSWTSSIGLTSKPTAKQKKVIDGLLDRFDLSHLSTRSFGSLSFGEARLILLMRSLVHQPQLLLLDEPFDGLDEVYRGVFLKMIQLLVSQGNQFLLVTHFRSEIPSETTHFVELKKGAINRIGPIKSLNDPLSG